MSQTKPFQAFVDCTQKAFLFALAALLWQSPAQASPTKTGSVNAMERAGNISTTYSGNMDVSPFTLGAFTINSGAASTNVTAATAAFSVTSSAGAVTQMQLSWDGKAFAPWEAYKVSRTISLPAGDGLKTLRAVFKDALGNLSNTYTASILRDGTAPAGSVVINEGAISTQASAVTLALQAVDAGSGQVQMQLSLDGTTWMSWESVAASRSITLLPGPGTRSVYVHFKDATGNLSPTTSDTIEVLGWTGSLSLNAGAPYSNNPGEKATTTTLTASTGCATTVAQQRFRWNGGAFMPWEPFTDTCMVSLGRAGTGDGIKTLSVQFMDSEGNVSPSYSDDILLDTKAPTARVSLNAGSKITTSTAATLTLTPDADPSGLAQMQFSVDGGAWTAWEAFKTTNPVTLPSDIGTHTVAAHVMDGAGNISSDLSDSIELTHFLPVSVTLNAGAAYTATTAGSARLSATSNAGAVTQMQLGWDGKSYAAWETYRTSRVVSIPTGDGLKTLYVIFKDAAGNVSKPFTASITRDNQAPTGSVQIEAGAATAPGSAVTLTLQAMDTASGQIQMQFSADYSNWSAFEAFVPSRSFVLLPGAGPRSAYVRFKDALGNLSPIYSDAIEVIGWSGSVSLNAGARYSNNTSLNATSATLQAATGIGTTVTLQQLSWDGITWTPWAAYATTTPVTLATSDGLKTLSARFQDSAGNVSPVYSAGIVLDTQAPTGTLVINEGDATTVISVARLTLQASDEASGVVQMAFSKDGGAWTSWEAFTPTRVVTLPAGAGNHTMAVRFKDGAGNQGMASDSITVAALAARDLFAQEKVLTGTQGIKASFPEIPSTTCHWTLISGTASGTLTGSADGNAVVYAVDDQVGTYQLKAELRNGIGGATSITRTLNVVSREFVKDPASATRRSRHTMTTLPNGRILVAGGENLASAELFDPYTETWCSAGNLQQDRADALATLLPDGRVLVAGGWMALASDPGRAELTSAELYDPASNTWTSVASPDVSFLYKDEVMYYVWDPDSDEGKTALLPGGQVLINRTSAAVYDPKMNTWFAVEAVSGSLVTLGDGRVLNVGSGPVNSFDLATDTWVNAGASLPMDYSSCAKLLATGRVLVVGAKGYRLYDPSTQTVSAEILIPDWNSRTNPHAALLLDGRVLVVEEPASSAPAKSGVYDPIANTWTRAGNLPGITAGPIAASRSGGAFLAGAEGLQKFDSSTLTWSHVEVAEYIGTQLPGGKVLMFTDTRASLYDPISGAWSSAGTMASPHGSFTLLPSGSVLCTGTTTELYNPASNTWSNASVPSTGLALKLQDGRLLVGLDKLYDPASNSWTPTGPLSATSISSQRLMLRPDGKVLLEAYSGSGGDWTVTLHLYDPSANTWSLWQTLGLATYIISGTGIPLPDGRYLSALGYSYIAGHYNGYASWAQLDDPATGASARTAISSVPFVPSMTLLPSGSVLVAGGEAYEDVLTWDGFLLYTRTIPAGSASVYDPVQNRVTATMKMNTPGWHASTLLQDGRVMFMGGGVLEFWKP